MGSDISKPHRYAAFISYAHADEAMAARLHKALETYPVPKHLRALGKTTKPIFRDVAELTAAHSLSAKIRDAVEGSKCLIVLCSSAAKASHWVNEEIRLFRELHGDASILSAIIEGTPETAFPQALTEDGREPLAAALGKDKAGFRLGVTQLAAGMLGTGLDELVQRAARRRNRIMGGGLAASLALSGIMGFTALQAVEARNEAQLERAESEALLDYMVKDLKVKLEPVGRLELLEGVGRKAIEYYDKKDIADLSDVNLRLLAAARQVLAQVALDAGRMKEAQREIEASAALTGEVLARNPDDTDAIYAHAQSEYWVGAYYRKQGKLAEMEKPWREYDRLAQILYKKDPMNFDWVMEAAYGKNSLGIMQRILFTQELAHKASENYAKSILYSEEAIKLKPDNKVARVARAGSMSGKASVLLGFGSATEAREFKKNHLQKLKSLTLQYPNDTNLRGEFYLSQTDFYNGYFLSLDESNSKNLKVALDQLFILAQNDTANLKNINFFLQAVCNTIESFNSSELSSRKSQIESLLRNIPENAGLDINYFMSMLQIFEIKIDLFTGEEGNAKETLRALRSDYLNKESYSRDDWKILYSIFLRNVELKNHNLSRSYAGYFLKHINSKSNLEYPTVLFKKLKAQLILGNCEQVIPLAHNLEARGYLERSEWNLHSCSDI